jgi:hypothetical protein
MRLAFSADRMLAQLAADASHERSDTVGPGPSSRPSAHVPSDTLDGPPRPGTTLTTEHPEWFLLATAIRIAVSGEPDELTAALMPDAVGWSPAGTYTSRSSAVALADRGLASLHVDTFEVTTLVWCAPLLLGEWHLETRHLDSMLIADDLLVEPSGRLITLAGAAVIEFCGDRISRSHVYFDDATLIEQVLLP